MNLIFGDGAIKQMCSVNPLQKRNFLQKIQAVAYLPLWLVICLCPSRNPNPKHFMTKKKLITTRDVSLADVFF